MDKILVIVAGVLTSWILVFCVGKVVLVGMRWLVGR